MRCSRNIIALAACLLIAGPALASKKDDKASAEALKDPKKDSGKKKGKEAGKTAGKPGAGAKPDTGPQKMSIPIVPGHDSLGLKIPYYSASTGKLQMIFNIEVANRIDADHLQMTTAQVETFKEDEQQEMVHEMTIDLPSSLLDLNTRVISTTQRVTIKREDFEITGQTMEFNTETKQGKLGGNVRMLIYNNENEVSKEEPKASE